MQKKLIFLLIFMVLITVFALQNSNEVGIQLWFWHPETSMALIIILTFAAGALAGILFSIPKRKKDSERTEKTSPPEEAKQSGPVIAEQNSQSGDSQSPSIPHDKDSGKYIEFEDV